MTDEVLAQIVVMWAERGENAEDVAVKLLETGHSLETVTEVMARSVEIIAAKQAAFMAHTAKEQIGWPD